MSCVLWSIAESQLGSAVVGGGITAIAAVATLYFTFKNDRKKQEIQQQQEADAFCGAVQAELESLLKRYMGTIGNSLSNHPSGEFFRMHYEASEDYFAVFNSNAHLLGKIEDADLRNQIVEVYVNIKGHLDSLKINNMMLLAYEKAYLNENQYKNEALYRQVVEGYRYNLIEYAKSLVSSHAIVSKLMESTIEKLKVRKR